MLSRPHSLCADCNFLKQLSICSHCAWEVPSPRPWATCGWEGLVMWPQMNLLPVAALSRSSWPSKDGCVVSFASRARSWVLRGSQKGLFRWVCLVTGNPHLLTWHHRSVHPCLSSLLQGCNSLCWSAQMNVHHTGLTKASLIWDHLSMWIGLLRDTSDLNSIKIWALLKRKKKNNRQLFRLHLWYYLFSGIFWGQTLVLGMLKQIHLRFIQLHP